MSINPIQERISSQSVPAMAVDFFKVIPNEVIQNHIMKFLRPSDLCGLMCTSKRFYLLEKERNRIEIKQFIHRLIGSLDSDVKEEKEVIEGLTVLEGVLFDPLLVERPHHCRKIKIQMIGILNKLPSLKLDNLRQQHLKIDFLHTALENACDCKVIFEREKMFWKLCQECYRFISTYKWIDTGLAIVDELLLRIREGQFPDYIGSDFINRCLTESNDPLCLEKAKEWPNEVGRASAAKKLRLE